MLQLDKLLKTPPCVCAQDFQFFNIERLTQLFDREHAVEQHKHALKAKEGRRARPGRVSQTLRFSRVTCSRPERDAARAQVGSHKTLRVS